MCESAKYGIEVMIMTLTAKDLGLVETGQSCCPCCGIHATSYTSDTEVEVEKILFCEDDGAVLFPDKPEMYKQRRKKIREWQKRFPVLSSNECSNCRQPKGMDEPYCGICGRRTYPMHWDEKAYRENLKRMRKSGQLRRQSVA
ncbi:MAG: hypothetical protein WCI57_04735 [Candidatus Berkelbacteria bacterium]